MTNKTSELIRSSQHRQILHWLLDESSTVSDISKGLGIRLPHASASMKQMRSAGLITRDTGSLRGALHRITSEGLQRFNKDCFIRAKKTISWPPPSKNHLMVIERSGNLILICYASIPQKTLFSIPSIHDYPLQKSNNTSSGNEGGPISDAPWITLLDKEPIWWDLNEEIVSSPPTLSPPDTIEAYVDTPIVIGISRAKILNSKNREIPEVGKWFDPQNSQNLPTFMKSGTVTIGKAGKQGPLVRPSGPIQAQIYSRNTTKNLLRNHRQNHFVIADGELVGNSSDKMPMDVLKNWLQLLHPRLAEKRIMEKYERLSDYLSKQKINSLTKMVVKDFGWRKWSKGLDCEFIDTTGMSDTAGEALIRWSLSTISKPFIIHAKWENLDLHELFSHHQEMESCKLVIAKQEFNFPTKVSQSPTNSNLRVHFPERISVYIEESDAMDSLVIPKDWVMPSHAQELRFEPTLKSVFHNPQDEIEAMWIATHLHEPNDDWAGKIASNFPLAAMLASSSENMVHKWRNLPPDIAVNWVDCLPTKSFNDAELVRYATQSETIFDELCLRVRKDPMRYNHLLSEPVVAATYLCSIEWVEDEYSEMILSAVKYWSIAPVLSHKVIQIIWKRPDLIANLHLENIEVEYKLLIENQLLSPVEQRKVMRKIHWKLWLHLGKTWLIQQLATHAGRTFLSKLDVPWAIILCDNPPEIQEIHLVNHLEKGIGKEALLDVYDAIKTVYAPPEGRTHPLVGWLFRKKIPFVSEEVYANEAIHLELYRRFHEL